ncbi:MAG: hypothetical protein IT361_14770 [Gemmatimonadaceae bacterium]|nr:hypothetical protein [Gemmatimonadaceae bacterium]
MALHLSFRAELANQVLLRLKRFDEAAWCDAERLAEARREYFDLAYTLAHDAVNLLIEEFGPDLRLVLDARLGDADALFSTLPTEESLETPAPRWRVARATVLAVYLRDSRGFNLGAFQALFAPVAARIDLGELERTALASLGEETGDFQVVKRYEPPAIIPQPDAKKRA